MSEKRKITPMPPEEIATLKAAIEKRWNEKPWYQGGDDPMGSPGCMMRAQEILSLIEAAEENASRKDKMSLLAEENDRLRETNRKLHRRAQIGEAVVQCATDYLAGWISVLKRKDKRWFALLLTRHIQTRVRKLSERYDVVTKAEGRDNG